MALSHVFLALLVSLLWGLNFVVTKAGLSELPPVYLAMLRFALVAILLAPWLKPMKGQMVRLVWIGLTAGALHFGLIFLGFSMTEHVGPVAVAVQINIPFMVLLAVVFLGERIGVYRIGGMVVAFSGVMLVGFDPDAFSDPWAFVMVCAGACFFAVSVVLMRRFDGGHPLQVQAWIALFSFPVLLFGTMVLETGQIESTMNATWVGWSAVIYIALGSTVIGHGSMFFLLQRYPVTYLVPFMIAPPVLGVLFGIWLYGDPITWEIVAGGLMTVAGVAVIQIREALATRRAKMVEAV
ncbi:MAG: DMT family transporter [Alphaproteobacteria bacterium]